MSDLEFLSNIIDGLLEKSMLQDELSEIINIALHIFKKITDNIDETKIKLSIREILEKKCKKVEIWVPLKFLEENEKTNDEYICDKLNNKQKERLKTLEILKKSKFIHIKPQEPEWFAAKKKIITATNIGKIVNDRYNSLPELFLEKCDVHKTHVNPKNCYHGNKYEKTISVLYSHIRNVKLWQPPLIISQKEYLGATPDFICESEPFYTTMEYDENVNKEKSENEDKNYDNKGGEKTKYSGLVGRLIEIKAPTERVIVPFNHMLDDPKIFDYYWQILTQLYSCGLDKCDFVQANIIEYNNVTEFINDTNILDNGKTANGLWKGAIIEMIKSTIPLRNVKDNDIYTQTAHISMPRFGMSNSEVSNWICEEMQTINTKKNEHFPNYVFFRILYFRVEYLQINLVIFDEDLFMSHLATIKSFWKKIQYFKKYPKKLQKIKNLYCEESENFTKKNKSICKKFWKIVDQNYEK